MESSRLEQDPVPVAERSRSHRPRARDLEAEHDLVIVGGGFGGLACALRAAELGLRPVLLEALNYPGGCAATFRRGGASYEAGATLFSGFGPGQLFSRWRERHGWSFAFDRLDPVVEMRTPRWRLRAGSDRATLRDQLLALPGAPRAGLRAFFARQERIADVLWDLLEHPDLLPPFGPGALLTHLRRIVRYAPLARWIGRPLLALLERDGIADFEPLRTWVDAVCQITLQCSAREVDAAQALGTLDYFWRGTGHVRGGIGELAWSMVDAIEASGGRVFLPCRARALRPRSGGGWEVVTTRGRFRARRVVANLLPAAVSRLLGEEAPRGRLGALDERVRRGWGACMLYLRLRDEGGGPPLPEKPTHLELVADPKSPLVEGNHLFCSTSGARERERAGRGVRTVTVSTHVRLGELLREAEPARGARVAEIQARMSATIAALVPEWGGRILSALPASPRTFERFTGRPFGYVGGIPRRASHRALLQWGTGPVRPDLHLVGDSLFPGQSTLAVALGGYKLAGRLAR